MFPTLGPFFFSSLSRSIVAVLLGVGIRCHMGCERHFDIQAQCLCKYRAHWATSFDLKHFLLPLKATYSTKDELINGGRWLPWELTT